MKKRLKPATTNLKMNPPARAKQQAAVDSTIEHSFPASDPPAWTASGTRITCKRVIKINK